MTHLSHFAYAARATSAARGRSVGDMTEARQSLGRAAEEEASRRLAGAGYRIVARNARVRYAEIGIAGEIDIVALDGRALVFVEVKGGRQGSRLGPERPLLAIGPRKRQRVRRVARAWLATNNVPGGFEAIRFDAIGVVLSSTGAVLDYEHVPAAF